jgi:hypothetical protein
VALTIILGLAAVGGSGARAADATARNPLGIGLLGVAAGGAIQDEPAAVMNDDLNIAMAAGARWIRIDINWAQVQAQGRDSYAWSSLDAVVKGAVARGLHVLGVIVYTPRWARPAGSSATYGPRPALYARFAAAAARHFGPLGVYVFEIWNEENSALSWTPRPRASAYTALLRAAYPAIMHASPEATVITGGLSPGVQASSPNSMVNFLRAIYDDGGRGYFDAVGAHPYAWPAAPGAAEPWSGWYQTYGARPSLRSIMVAHGDGGKRIWATEFGAPTYGPTGRHVTLASQASMIVDAYRLWDTYPWAGPLFVYQPRDGGINVDSSSDFYGLTTPAGYPKPAFFAYREVAGALARQRLGTGGSG